ncbi:MAG: RND transporter, partial [Boseongicola sp.]|nr:RND transporter [Boseongicola sp.]
VLVVPTSAVFRTDNRWSVFKANNGIVELTFVDIGNSDGSLTEVVGGLEESDRVILYPSAAVEDGIKVESRQ